MVNLALIEEEIDELINTAPTTYETCEKLAHLTITRDLLLQRMNYRLNGERGDKM